MRAEELIDEWLKGGKKALLFDRGSWVAQKATAPSKWIFSDLAKQAVRMDRQQYHCPACGGRRPHGHKEGCEVVKQLGAI